MPILDLWGISVHAVVVFGLCKDLLFKCVLGHCARRAPHWILIRKSFVTLITKIRNLASLLLLVEFQGLEMELNVRKSFCCGQFGSNTKFSIYVLATYLHNFLKIMQLFDFFVLFCRLSKCFWFLLWYLEFVGCHTTFTSSTPTTFLAYGHFPTFNTSS